jgi:hypothetical protein
MSKLAQIETVNKKGERIIGGAKGDRTPDLMTASHALSQLSYGPTLLCLDDLK